MIPIRTVIGVMGSGDPLDDAAFDTAFQLGALIARKGWVLLTGGRASGVMDAASRGAHENGGLVVGVLPDADTSNASEHLDVAIRTGLGDARNTVNVLSSDVVIALPGGAGTLSEIALALKARKKVVCLGMDPGDAFVRYRRRDQLVDAARPEDALEIAERFLQDERDNADWWLLS